MTPWSFCTAVALVIVMLALIGARLAGLRVPLPRFRRRPLIKHAAEPARLALHLGTATPRIGGFSPRRIGL
jgi:hypothetical protein